MTASTIVTARKPAAGRPPLSLRHEGLSAGQRRAEIPKLLVLALPTGFLAVARRRPTCRQASLPYRREGRHTWLVFDSLAGTLLGGATVTLRSRLITYSPLATMIAAPTNMRELGAVVQISQSKNIPHASAV